MDKNQDFDKWNIEKKKSHASDGGKFYNEREVWWCSLGLNVGFEQNGKGDDFARPVLIVKGFSKQVCIVLPLTTSTKKSPFHFYIGKINGKDAQLITSQIKLIDAKRLINKIDVVDKEIFEEVRKTVKDLL